MNKLSSSEKTLLYILLVAATCVVCIWFVLLPTFQSYEELGLQLETAKQQEADVQMKLAEGVGLREKIDEMKEKAEIEKELFLTIENKEVYQRWIVDVAKVAGLSIQSLSISNKEIVSVAPYTVPLPDESYPIGAYYIASINDAGKTTEEVPTEEPGSAVEEGGDKVIKTNFLISVKGNQDNIIKFMDVLSKSTKHIIVESLPLPAFDMKEGKETMMSISIYTIDKENDGLFDRYRF